MAQAKPLKYPNATRESVWVSSKSNISKCIEEIQGKFAKQNKDNPCLIKKRNHRKFVKSCFDTLYKWIKNIVLSGCIIHNMLITQVESVNENVMEFNFNGKEPIFTKKKFDITGLKIDTSFDAPPPPHCFRVLVTYYYGCRKIKNSELWEKFIGLTIDDLEFAIFSWMWFTWKGESKHHRQWAFLYGWGLRLLQLICMRFGVI